MYVVITPRPAGGYPTDLNVSEEGVVLIGVVNHEFERVDYAIRAERVAVVVMWNETGGYNETVEVSPPTSLAWLNPTLEHESNWTQPFAFSIDGWGVEGSGPAFQSQ